MRVKREGEEKRTKKGEGEMEKRREKKEGGERKRVFFGLNEPPLRDLNSS